MPKGVPIYGFDRLQRGEQMEMLFVTPGGLERRRQAAYSYGYRHGWVIRCRQLSPVKLLVKRAV